MAKQKTREGIRHGMRTLFQLPSLGDIGVNVKALDRAARRRASESATKRCRPSAVRRKIQQQASQAKSSRGQAAHVGKSTRSVSAEDFGLT